MITTYPFDDSLRLLSKRQMPPRQTQRGNYEWSWAFAPFVEDDFEQASVGWNPAIGPTAQVLDVLLFGADVPHLQMFLAVPVESQRQWPQNVAAYQVQFNAWAGAFAAWAPTYAPNPPLAPVPAPVLAPLPRVCTTSVDIVPRATLSAYWGASDPGQGALVACNYANKDGVAVFVEGFPARVNNPKCGPGVNPVGAVSVNGALLIGYESAINHGIAPADPTPDVEPPVQPAYFPVLYPAQAYTPAMRAAGNIVTSGTNQIRIMGLYYNGF